MPMMVSWAHADCQHLHSLYNDTNLNCIKVTSHNCLHVCILLSLYLWKKVCPFVFHFVRHADNSPTTSESTIQPSNAVNCIKVTSHNCMHVCTLLYICDRILENQPSWHIWHKTKAATKLKFYAMVGWIHSSYIKL